MPVAKSWSPSCPRPSPLVSSEAPRVRLRFVIPRTHGFGTRTTPGNPVVTAAPTPIPPVRSRIQWPAPTLSKASTIIGRPGSLARPAMSRSAAARICGARSPTTLIMDRRSFLVWLFIVVSPVVGHPGPGRAMASPEDHGARSACDLTGDPEAPDARRCGLLRSRIGNGSTGLSSGFGPDHWPDASVETPPEADTGRPPR
jgi:hypothetical protein